MIWLVVVPSLLIVWALIELRRINLVYNYRTQLLKQVDRLCRADIKADRPWHWRFEAFNAVSFNEMANKFWRPLDSFYPDQRFLDPEARGADRAGGGGE